MVDVLLDDKEFPAGETHRAAYIHAGGKRRTIRLESRLR